jgi:hypothetical protein
MAKKGGNPQNFVPDTERTPERIKKIRSMAGKKSGVVRKERKLLSQMYADLLAKGFEIEGERLSLGEVASAILSRKDAASVSMLKATEGSKNKLVGENGGPVEISVIKRVIVDAGT